MTRAGQIRDLPCEIDCSDPIPDEVAGGLYRDISVTVAAQEWHCYAPEAELSEALEAAYWVRGALNRHEDERRHRENRAAMMENDPTGRGRP